MISFGPTDEQELVRSTLREFAADVLRPAAREADEASRLPDGLLDQAWQLGLTNTQLPGTLGGGDETRSPVTNALVLEELGWGDAALGLAVAQPSLFAFAVADLGTAEQKQRWLPLFTGARFPAASVAWIEPSPVFDALALQTTADSCSPAGSAASRSAIAPSTSSCSRRTRRARRPASLRSTPSWCRARPRASA
jgi:alkylation response protein AidB-like acyl-CoA dehydrogenase